MIDNSFRESPPRRCSKGHVSPWWECAALGLGDATFCMKCIEERLPALLDWLGIGRILPLEEAQDDHPM